jgi:hypothetical protein
VVITGLTRNRGRYSVASTPESLVCSGFLRYYVIKYFSRSPHEISPNSQFFLSRFFNRGRKNRVEIDTERYRSGHNGADSKSVCGQPHAGSNPALSAKIV